MVTTASARAPVPVDRGQLLALGGLVCVGGVDVGDAEAEAAPLGCRWLWHRALLIADGWVDDGAWSVDDGAWSVDDGAWSVDDGVWSDGPEIWRAPPASDRARLAALERTDEQWQNLVDALEAQALAEPVSAAFDDGLEGVDADGQETTPAGELARAEAWRARWFGPSGWPVRHRARLECAGLASVWRWHVREYLDGRGESMGTKATRARRTVELSPERWKRLQELAAMCDERGPGWVVGVLVDAVTNDGFHEMMTRIVTRRMQGNRRPAAAPAAGRAGSATAAPAAGSDVRGPRS